MAQIGDALSDRTEKFRRNVIAISFVVILVEWYSDKLDLSKLSIFGLGPSQGHETIVWTVALGLLAYQSVLFTIYARIDGRRWITSLRGHVPHLRALFTRTKFNIVADKRKWEYEYPVGKFNAIDFSHQNNVWQKGSIRDHSDIDQREFRDRLLSFIALDLGVPMLFAVAAFSILVCRLVRC